MKMFLYFWMKKMIYILLEVEDNLKTKIHKTKQANLFKITIKQNKHHPE